MEDRSNYWLRRKATRRTTLRGAAIAGVGAGAFALVGCGDDDDDDEGGTGQPTTSASVTTVAKQPKPGGKFSFQMNAIPAVLDPYTVTSYQTAYLNGMSYSKLLRFKAGVPEVAPADNAMEPDLLPRCTSGRERPTPFKLRPHRSQRPRQLGRHPGAFDRACTRKVGQKTA